MDVESKISGTSSNYLFFITRESVVRWAASVVVLEILDRLSLKRHSVAFVRVVKAKYFIVLSQLTELFEPW